MSSACTTVLEIFNHSAAKNSSKEPLKPQCDVDFGFANDGYKLANQAKTNRQGSKRRTTWRDGVTFESGVAFGSFSGISTGTSSNTAAVKKSTDKDKVNTPKKKFVGNVDALLKPVTTTTSGLFSASQENIPNNSYASVVSRRKDGDSLNVYNFENEFSTVTDNFAKLGLPTISSTPAMSTSAFDKKQVSTRDVGIQVDLPIKGKGTGTAGSKSQWTMTNRKGLYKNKCVTAKICCNDEDKITAHPPVQFLGDQFNFESAVATSVSQLGIKFLEDVDDEAVPIFPKSCN